MFPFPFQHVCYSSIMKQKYSTFLAKLTKTQFIIAWILSYFIVIFQKMFVSKVLYSYLVYDSIFCCSIQCGTFIYKSNCERRVLQLQPHNKKKTKFCKTTQEQYLSKSKSQMIVISRIIILKKNGISSNHKDFRLISTFIYCLP